MLVYDNEFHRDHSRILEIGPVSGEIVWEVFNLEMIALKRWRIYRMMRYSPEHVDWLLGEAG